VADLTFNTPSGQTIARELLIAYGSSQCDQAGIRDRPLYRSPGRQRHPHHVFQQYPHHLCNRKSGRHRNLERTHVPVD